MVTHVLAVLGVVWVFGLILYGINWVWAAVVVRNRHKWLERREGGED